MRPPTSISVADTSSSAVTVQWMFLGPFSVTLKETCIVMFGGTSGSLDSKSSAVTADDGHLTYSGPLNSLTPGTDYKYVIHCWNMLIVLELQVKKCHLELVTVVS